MLAIRDVLNNPSRCQDVVARRLIFCAAGQSLPIEDRLLVCWNCDRFVAYCCACTMDRHRAEESQKKYGSRVTDASPPKPCHYYRVALVDGACLGNGHDGAAAGIGIAIGRDPATMHWAIPIGDSIDPAAVRTSQRAELLAALYGIRKLAMVEMRPRDMRGEERRMHLKSAKITWVITSDSEYVVLGMTEWVPNWKSNGWRNSSGRKPKNLDLFQKLDAVVDDYEREYDVRIAFWHISRVHNELADRLAGIAARGNTVEPTQFEEQPDSDDDIQMWRASHSNPFYCGLGFR